MKKIAITVGQFIYRKGFDILLNAWALCDKEYELYIIGAEPTKEYIDIKDRLHLKNVHFEGFKTKEELKCYYQAADLFVLPTREDIWGLVVNEAMANGLPVITTDHCVAGIELVQNGENGYIVPTEDCNSLAERIMQILGDDELCYQMGRNSLIKIREYTIEKMAKTHMKILEKDQSSND